VVLRAITREEKECTTENVESGIEGQTWTKRFAFLVASCQAREHVSIAFCSSDVVLYLFVVAIACASKREKKHNRRKWSFVPHDVELKWVVFFLHLDLQAGKASISNGEFGYRRLCDTYR